jgi:hypothetical protein
MLGFALTPDGKSLFVGGLVDRLLYAAVPDLIASPGAEFAFEKRANVQVQCLATDGATLWACSNEVSGFLVGASTDGGQSFTRKLGLSTLRGVASCPANARTAQCNALWPAQANELGIVVDAGAPVVDGGIVQDASTSLDASCTDCAASPPKSCGCTEVGNLLASESSPWAFTAAMAAALTTALRRRWGVKRRL